jgi:hypothetical protein
MIGTGLLATWFATRPGQDSGPVWFLPPWFAAVLWGTYRSATMPHTIQTTREGEVRFVGTFRTTVVPGANFKAIKAAGAFVEIKHTKGKILLLHEFTGFHEFLTELKRTNPSVALKGV